jgi:peptidyl-prolyl cis-trans isomerase C
MKAHNWTLRSLAGAALLAATATGSFAQPAAPAAAGASATPAKLAAVVNGEPIPMEEVERFLKDRPVPPQLSDEQRRQLRFEIVGMLVDDHLLQQFLKTNAPPVKEADVNKWLVELEAGLKSQGHTLKEFYQERGVTEQQVRKNVSNMLQWVNYVNLKVTEADLKHYYEENKDFFDQVSVHACHILVRVAPTASPAERQAAKAQLQGLRQQIVSGKLDFSEAAKKVSQCPSKAQGGDIGYFPRKFAVEESFARAAFALKAGDISDVVETDLGYHLIKVVDRKQGQTSSFAKIKDEVREVAAEEMRQNLLAHQRKTSKIEILIDGAPALKTPGAAN